MIKNVLIFPTSHPILHQLNHTHTRVIIIMLMVLVNILLGRKRWFGPSQIKLYVSLWRGQSNVCIRSGCGSCGDIKLVYGFIYDIKQLTLSAPFRDHCVLYLLVFLNWNLIDSPGGADTCGRRRVRAGHEILRRDKAYPPRGLRDPVWQPNTHSLTNSPHLLCNPSAVRNTRGGRGGLCMCGFVMGTSGHTGRGGGRGGEREFRIMLVSR